MVKSYFLYLENSASKTSRFQWKIFKRDSRRKISGTPVVSIFLSLDNILAVPRRWLPNQWERGTWNPLEDFIILIKLDTIAVYLWPSQRMQNKFFKYLTQPTWILRYHIEINKKIVSEKENVPLAWPLMKSSHVQLMMSL